MDEAERGYHGLLELRRLHRELDISICCAYDWTNLDLGHDFHEVETLPENDRVRYTISPAARKQVLKRLLALKGWKPRSASRRAELRALALKRKVMRKDLDDGRPAPKKKLRGAVNKKRAAAKAKAKRQVRPASDE